MAHINIEFTLFSAFYSPLISLMSGGFLKAEGLDADWTVSAPRRFRGKGAGGTACRCHPVRSEPGVHQPRQGRNANGHSFCPDQ
jgi:hypothetical protein